MKRISSILIVLMLSVFFAGCGYSTRSSIRSDLKTIYIDDFKNKIDFTSASGQSIYFPLLEINVRDAIVSRFQFDGNLRISKEDNADLILRGVLTSYSRDVLRRDDNDDVEEYRARITISLELYDVVQDKIFWVEPGFSGEKEYFVSGTLAISEEAAVLAATEDLAKRVVERTIEHW